MNAASRLGALRRAQQRGELFRQGLGLLIVVQMKRYHLWFFCVFHVLVPRKSVKTREGTLCGTWIRYGVFPQDLLCVEQAFRCVLVDVAPAEGKNCTRLPTKRSVK